MTDNVTQLPVKKDSLRAATIMKNVLKNETLFRELWNALYYEGFTVVHYTLLDDLQSGAAISAWSGEKQGPLSKEEVEALYGPA